MPAFQGAHNFNIHHQHLVDNSQVVVDNSSGKNSALNDLRDAACIGAGHQSAERFDPPKCHPETRQAAINDIMTWVNLKDPKERIMWMNGPAGTGKSSIAQTIAEICHGENKLISSFFFSRTAATKGIND